MRRSLIALVVLWLAVIAGVGVGQERRTTIGVEEIQPGMRGYGLTVFRGTAPERFDVEVIGVLHNFRPDMNLILVRTDHPILDHASTVAGMSGSPIYLDGRLAGAYAYGWPFGKDPVAGVTPIASMFAEMQRPVRPDAFPGADRLTPLPRRRPSAAVRDASRSPRLAGLRPFVGDEARTAWSALDEHARGDAGALATATGPRGMRRASTPVMLGGLTDSVAHLLAERLEPLGLLALQAGGAATTPAGGEPARFVDGGAIGVQLIRGDIAATGVGTVTHVGRQRIVAFGHPMLNAGEVGLPTSTARVLHILASESRSFKLAEALEPLGTLIQDRQPAIVIDPSLQAETVPVHIHIHGAEGAPRTDWNVEVASNRALTPMLVFAAIANAVEATSADQTDIVYTARSRVTVEGHQPVEVVDHGYMAQGPNDPRGLGRLRLFELMEVAYGNPFEETRLREVDLDLTVRFERDFYEIVDASVTSEEVDPGGQANVQVVLRRRGEPDQIRVVPVAIPTSAAGKSVEISIEAGDDVRLEHRQARNVSDLFHIVREQLPSTSMVVSLKMHTRGLTFRGHVVRDLPMSALDSLQMVNDTENSRPFVTYDRQTHPFGSVLGGSAKLTLRVRETPRGR